MMMELWDKGLKATVINVPKGLKNTLADNKESYKKEFSEIRYCRRKH